MTEIETLPQAENRSTLARLTPAQVKADYDLVKQAMGGCMTVGHDYGTIPGTPKPTLFKPGAEKLMLIFKLAGKPIIEDLSTSDEIRYRVSTEICHTPSGTIVGYGVGEASTNEEKYRWRRAICKEEFDEVPEDRRRKKWGSKEGKTFSTMQVRTNPADLANTILKMADKRSLISGALKVTAASSVFSQDMEDLSKEVREAVAQAEEGTMPPPIKEPQRKSAPAASAPAPAATAPAPAVGTPSEQKKAPDTFLAMNSKIDGGTCATCSAHIAKDEPIWFDKKERKAHCKGHFG